MFASIMLGMLAAVAPDRSKARGAALWLYTILSGGVPPKTGSQRPPITGNVEFVDVEFAYPTRPDAQVSARGVDHFSSAHTPHPPQVLNKLNLKITAGKTLALVGHSGCGKSTIIGLLERFYQPKSGRILVSNGDWRFFPRCRF